MRSPRMRTAVPVLCMQFTDIEAGLLGIVDITRKEHSGCSGRSFLTGDGHITRAAYTGRRGTAISYRVSKHDQYSSNSFVQTRRREFWINTILTRMDGF